MKKILLLIPIIMLALEQWLARLVKRNSQSFKRSCAWIRPNEQLGLCGRYRNPYYFNSSAFLQHQMDD